MNKNKIFLLKTSLLFSLVWPCVYAEMPTLTFEGVSGSNTIGRLDIFTPVSFSGNHVFFADLQGKFGTRNDDWFSGFGFGCRQCYSRGVFGGYLFADYNQTEFKNHFTVVNAGVEYLNPWYDLHFNAYAPIDRQHAIPQSHEEVVEFKGHQQFNHLFINLEEVGYGADMSFGTYLPNFFSYQKNLRAIAGPYYFHINNGRDIIGASARLELPLNHSFCLSMTADYNNVNHGSLVGGLTYFWQPSCSHPIDMILEPVVRNIATSSRGMSIPTEKTKKFQRVYLARDDIYFFQNYSADDHVDGSFEHPFASSQMNQETLNQLGKGAQIYLSEGIYEIGSNSINQLTLVDEQSIFGRTNDFKNLASKDKRPVIKGGLVIGEGSHIIDSIRLEVTNPKESNDSDMLLVGVNIYNATDVTFNNDLIHVNTTVLGDNNHKNMAIGINANNSYVTIKDSRIEVQSAVSGSNYNFNIATGLGNINGDFRNNRFIITHSSIMSNAKVSGDSNNGYNLASGIGLDVIDSIGFLENNSFEIKDLKIESLASILGNNVADAMSEDFVAACNLATGIGNNVLSLNDSSNSHLSGNTFDMSQVAIKAQALVSGNNLAMTQNVYSGSNAFNMVSGIGNNAINLTDNARAIVSDNAFVLANSTISTLAKIGSNTSGLQDNYTVLAVYNQATGIGNNATSSLGTTLASFQANKILLSNTTVASNVAIVYENCANSGVFGDIVSAFNLATGIGNNIAVSLGNLEATFDQNDISLVTTTITAKAAIGEDNLARTASPSSYSSAYNLVLGLGNNVAVEGGNAIGSFDLNKITSVNSKIEAINKLQGENLQIYEYDIQTAIAYNMTSKYGINLANYFGNAVAISDNYFMSN